MRGLPEAEEIKHQCKESSKAREEWSRLQMWDSTVRTLSQVLGYSLSARPYRCITVVTEHGQVGCFLNPYGSLRRDRQGPQQGSAQTSHICRKLSILVRGAVGRGWGKRRECSCEETNSCPSLLTLEKSERTTKWEKKIPAGKALICLEHGPFFFPYMNFQQTASPGKLTQGGMIPKNQNQKHTWLLSQQFHF